jgi:hypothetical protein
MEITGDYQADGFALIEGLVPVAVCNAFLRQMKADFDERGAALESISQTSALLTRGAVEVYGYHYPPMLAFLWGLTPTVRQIAGRDLIPTYDYFRIYREGDVCRVHSDRPSCEHSLSLTLDYSDGEPWDLEIGTVALTDPQPIVEDDFGAMPSLALRMQPGDAVIYNGVHRRHGRVTPNPNAWSAHLFCHWVERGGVFESAAFDGNAASARPVNFQFA